MHYQSPAPREPVPSSPAAPDTSQTLMNQAAFARRPIPLSSHKENAPDDDTVLFNPRVRLPIRNFPRICKIPHVYTYICTGNIESFGLFLSKSLHWAMLQHTMTSYRKVTPRSKKQSTSPKESLQSTKSTTLYSCPPTN